ncbi:phage holin family protein [Ruminococcus sp.]|uniref:phage holin family protein n=1 Tax=Ruminococcus sp. TaxID=41978 RepID=UPI0025DBB1CC|nr:phage holin family protein [Ruminococcus sp.]MBQ8965874.1 phage holin family protein [Ruminococcus sp.]
MRENVFKAVFAVIVGGLTAYFREIAIPLVILIAVMIIDYASGMIKAWINAELSSKTGIKGIIKKVSYLLVVCVAAVVDWLITSGLQKIGISIDINYLFGVIVAIWLIINELISILENLAVIGVPLPPFLTQTVHKLKIAVENNTEKEETDNE